MGWFENLKTRSKLLLSFGVLCALLIGLAVMAYRTLVTIERTERAEVGLTNSANMKLTEIRADLNRIRGRMFELFLTDDEPQRIAIQGEVAERVQDVQLELDGVRSILGELGHTEELATVAELARHLTVFFGGRAEVAKLILEGRTDDARLLLVGVQSRRFEEIREHLLTLGARLKEEAATAAAQSERLSAEAVRAFVAVSIGVLLFALLMVWLLNRLIAAPLRAVAGLADRVAAGDLTVRVEGRARSDEVGLLQRALRLMLGNLRETNRELREGLGTLASSSSEILAAVSQAAASATETAAAATQTATTTEELKQTAYVSNQKAKAVQEAAQRAAAVSETGRKAVIETFDGMNGIREQMESIAESVVRLSEQGQAIGDIVATVNDLAQQSNLLAVNAAIEATRAGEYGKGFAVVALEVRSLAEQSRQATTQVRTILMEVQKATSAAVLATEQGTKTVAAGVKQATDAGESIRTLTGGVSEAAQAATQIAAAIQQQLLGMDQIASAIANIRDATTQNVAGSKQVEVSAMSLLALGGRLQALVEKQRVES